MNYLDELIEHQILLDFYGNSISQWAEDELYSLEEHLDEILLEYDGIVSKKVLSSAEAEINSKIDEFINHSAEYLEKKASEISEKESSWFMAFLLFYLATKDMKPSKLNLIEIPYSDRFTVKSYLSNLKGSLKNLYSTALKSAYHFGMEAENIIGNLKKRVRTLSNGMKGEFHTMTTSFAKRTEEEIIQNNIKSFDTLVWCSILDSSTCLLCGSLHKTVYSSVSSAPMIPVHERCRCFLVPVKGEMPEMKAYSEWLSEQDNDIQLEILGRRRFELYQSGMTVENFINDGRVLTLKELYGE